MQDDIFSRFVKLPRGAEVEEVAAVIGRPYGKANGMMRGWTLIGFQGLNLEISFWKGRLVSLDLHFEPFQAPDAWPTCIVLPEEFSAAMNEEGLVEWLNGQPYTWSKKMVGDNPHYIVNKGQLQFVVTDGHLESMWLSDPLVDAKP